MAGEECGFGIHFSGGETSSGGGGGDPPPPSPPPDDPGPIGGQQQGVFRAHFSADPRVGDVPLLVQFTDRSTPGLSGSITSWRWEFGDGGGSTLKNPTYLYLSEGDYTVALTVTKSGGAADTEIKQDFIETTAPVGAPVAAFSGTPLTGTAPLTVNFTDASTGTVTGWQWNFGDGATSTSTNPSHVYGPGVFTVTLTVQGPGGQDTEQKVSYVVVQAAGSPPVVDFVGTPLSGQVVLNVSFTDLSVGSPPPTSWLWNFGDGTSGSTLQNPTHPYVIPGTYNVSLQATNSSGIGALTKTGYVTCTQIPAPVADFSGTPLSGATPLNVTFTDLSTGTIDSRLWNFGDGGSSTATNPSHSYTGAGVYTVSLTVQNAGGQDTETKNGYIAVSSGSPPTVDFVGVPTSAVAPFTVVFTDQSTGSPAPTSWFWQFGDGSTSTLRNPSHTYVTGGDFDVGHTATNTNGTGSLIKIGYIHMDDPASSEYFVQPVINLFSSDFSLPNQNNANVHYSNIAHEWEGDFSANQACIIGFSHQTWNFSWTDCTFKGIPNQSGPKTGINNTKWGMRLYDIKDLDIYNCKFEDVGIEHGIYVNDMGNVSIRKSLFQNCAAQGFQCVFRNGITSCTFNNQPNSLECTLNPNFFCHVQQNESGGPASWSELPHEILIDHCEFYQCNKNVSNSSFTISHHAHNGDNACGGGNPNPKPLGQNLTVSYCLMSANHSPGWLTTGGQPANSKGAILMNNADTLRVQNCQLNYNNPDRAMIKAAELRKLFVENTFIFEGDVEITNTPYVRISGGTSNSLTSTKIYDNGVLIGNYAAGYTKG